MGGSIFRFPEGGRGWGHCLTQRGGMGRGRIKLPGGGGHLLILNSYIAACLSKAVTMDDAMMLRFSGSTLA